MIGFELTKKRVVIYARVSTEHEAQLSALENQVDWYKPIMAAHPEWELVDQFIDEGITGTSAKKRPQFMKMIASAKRREFDMIITREVSRFARNTVDTLQYTRDLKRWGVEVFFINDNIKTFDGDGELRLTIMATLAQDESRKTSIRVKAGQQTSMNNGVFYGNGNILGYDRVERIVEGNRKQVDFVINPEQARTVRFIFDMYLDGKGLSLIKDELERRGMRTATGKTNWHESCLSHILKNSFYCGIITYHKEYVPDYLEQKKIKNYGALELTQTKGRHEAIITVEEFERVQAIMKSKRNTPVITPDGRQCKGKKPSKDIWCKLLVCKCGHGVNRVHWSGAKSTHKVAYRCREVIRNGTPENRKKKGLPYEGYCNTPMVPQWKLTLMAKYVFTNFLNRKDEVLDLANAMLEAHIKDTPDLDDNAELIITKQTEIDKLEKRFETLLTMRMDGEITADVFISSSQEIREKIDRLKSEISALTIDEPEEPVVDYEQKITVLRYALERYTHFDEYDEIPECVIEAFVRKIVIFEDHFEWHLRFDNPDQPTICGVNGNKKGNPSVWVGEASASPVGLEQDRLRLATRGNEELTPHFSYTFRKSDAEAYHNETHNKYSVRKWKDITVNVLI